LGIAPSADGKVWRQFSTWTPGIEYNSEQFYQKATAVNGVWVFDPIYFSKRLAHHLVAGFARMGWLVSLSVTGMLYLYFRKIVPVLVSLIPIAFALAGTLGTLRLMGRPLDIPSIMISVILFGIGLDYSMLFIESYQEYGGCRTSQAGLIRMTIFLTSVSTLIGFGVLCFAKHSLLKSAGLCSFFGISYTLVGVFCLLPPILSRMYPEKVQIENA
jgi:predicted RND superfamily exporter protein